LEVDSLKIHFVSVYVSYNRRQPLKMWRRPHRVNAALDRLRERQDPTTLRLVVQARLPRGQGRPARYEYQRVASWRIDCRTQVAVKHVRACLRDLIREIDRVQLIPADD
jgi:hypothetical protein